MSAAAGRAPSPAPGVKLFNPKHKQQPLTRFKRRYSWMTAEPKQTKWEARRESNWPNSVGAAARVTLSLPVSGVGVCCCVNYSSSRSRRREQPLWNRFKWNVPPGGKQLPSSPAGEGFHQAAPGGRRRRDGRPVRALRHSHLAATRASRFFTQLRGDSAPGAKRGPVGFFSRGRSPGAEAARAFHFSQRKPSPEMFTNVHKVA
ncbi:PREDICTED: uncharacterized protein LOC106148660 [Chinchilla lanigera]|uniref:uncharacterized protein LOC106148660 n=1 Tax=Chinchilla lanigera TaxID=34839 RepID=UPI000696C55D|nr:PREDICTED: uncharacterized protein LOC106148660 [Chinchilla lanigera]